MALRHIRLELVRDRDFPDGSAERGYEFHAQLTDDGHLVHRGRGWAFHCDDEPAEEDEPLFKLDRHTLVEGEYVSITEHDGVLRTFRVVRLR